MSVIVGRALPDVRDGLKPVQRRILFAMHELGLTPDRPYRKCARVVGDVLGKYHPHGDQAVYDALVRLVQNFSCRYPILDGHGNFGSVDDDPPAAMRYTETRLAPIAFEGLLDEIGSETVDFANNFDGSHQEPTVLPAQLPFLLLNGCSGIAVGMATSIPPHNLNEVIEGVISLIKKPNLNDEELLKIIPGPDFPTGGEILMGSGIRETYLKGKGSIPMKGITHTEEIQPGKGKHKRTAIIITELPYQLSKANWIEKLADLVNNGKIGGIADIRDESDRDGMRIVIELRRDTDPKKINLDLQQKTSLQSNFSAILLALVHGQPKQLSLKNILEQFIEYRELTILRRTKFNLKKTTDRLEIVQGLIKALSNLQLVIELIQNSKDVNEARSKLTANIKLNEKQSEAVLGMPLRRLTTLERKNLNEEIKTLEAKKEELELIINNREILLKKLIYELKILKKQYGTPRKTKIIEGGDQLIAAKIAITRPNAELQRKQAYNALPNDGRLLIQSDNQVKIISPQVIGRLHLNESLNLGNGPAPAKLIWKIEENFKLLAVSKTGRIAIVKWEFAGQQPGSLEKFLPGGLEKDKIINLIPIPLEENISIGLLSSDGKFKRISKQEIMDLSGRAATIVKLKENVILKSAVICNELGNIIFVTDIGRIIKIKVNDDEIPLMGKLAQGPTLIKLLPGETITKAISTSAGKNKTIILISRQGKLVKLNIDTLQESKKGYLGEIGLSLKDKKNSKDRIIDICFGEEIIGVVTNQKRHGRIIGDLIKTTNCFNQSKIQLNEKEEILELIPLISNIKI